MAKATTNTSGAKLYSEIDPTLKLPTCHGALFLYYPRSYKNIESVESKAQGFSRHCGKAKPR